MSSPEYLSPEYVLARTEAGEAALVDLRSSSAFAQAHLPAAVSLPFSLKGLVQRLALVLPQRTALVLLAADDATASLAWQQFEAGPFPLLGIVEGGIERCRDDGLPLQSLPEVASHQLMADFGGIVLDVREPIEWETGHVPDAILISLGDLRQNLHRIPRSESVAVVCEGGIRSCTAASVLLRSGFERVANVPDGTRGYRSAPGLPLQYWTGDNA